MASAYGKLTGHVAACLSISGPGTTNLVTGLYDAQLEKEADKSAKPIRPPIHNEGAN